MADFQKTSTGILRVHVRPRGGARVLAAAAGLAALSVLSARTAPAQPVPSTSLSVPASTFIGTAVSSTVTFSNSGSAAGYGPYVDLLLPAGGADGNDGLTFTGATFLGAPVAAFGPFPAAGPFTGSVVNHPLARTNTGASATVTVPAGYQLVVLLLPFGSFVPGQPPAAITVNASMSNLADAGFPLTIQARGGFQYGADPVDNPTTDPSIFPGSFPAGSATTPTVLSTAKAYNGPESETATGPDYPRSYTVTVSVAAGQTVTNLDVTDLIPSNVQFLSVSTVPASSAIATPSTVVPGGTLTRRFASITGTGGADATVTVNFFVPRDALGGAPVLNLSSGAPATSTDQASAAGSWTPIDPRDAAGTVTSNTATHVLTDKSLALQKSIVNLDHPGATRPGDRLQITLQGQVSDFFAFQNLVAADTLSDGQHYDTTFTPTLAVNGNAFILASAGMNVANFTEVRHWTGGPPVVPVNGTTDLTFRVSNELVTRGRPNGRLVGGCIPPAGTGGVGTLPNCSTYNDGASTFTLVYQTIIQQNYTDTHSGKPVVQGDGVSDAASVSGDVLAYSDAATPTGSSAADTSAASVSIVQGSLVKSVYAVNGVVCSPSCGRPTAGQTVTYRLVYQLPRSSFESLTLQDFLPLPVFDVTSGPFPSAITVFDGASGATPAAGHAAYGATDTFHLLPAAPAPALSVTAATNSVTFTYAAYLSAPLYPSSVVDLLFSVTVTNKPFADGLFLTNQVQSNENGSTGASQVAANIVQIQIGEPDVRITKGTVAKNDAAAVFAPATVGPVAFNAPGTAGNRWAGTISSTGLATSPVASVVTNVQAADLVTFAIVLENKGSGVNGAFDVKVRDTLPAGFAIPGGGLNLRAADGTGTAVAFTDLGGSLFGSGIQLTDGANGALAPFDAANGKNLVVVTYDLQVAVTATALSVLPNTATLFNFASQSGGPTFTTGRTASSSATLKGPALGKTANRATATIGDTIDYTVTLTVPQGTTPGATVTDTLPAGLAYVSTMGAVLSPGVTITGSALAPNPAVVSPGQSITYTLGDVTNADSNPAVSETIAITYRVVVLNVAGNHGSAPATTLQNTARLSFTGFPNVASASAPAVTVLEPALTAGKSVVVGGAGTQGDAGDSVAYTITISHTGASTAPAFDVTVSDPLPKVVAGNSLIVGPTFTAVDNPGGTNVAAAFALTGADATGWTFATTGAPALNLALGHTITITINGSLADRSLLTPNQSIVNTADVRWTSVSGNPGTISAFNTNSTERDGSGTPNNNYRTTPSATLTVFPPAPAKSIVATSEAGTADPTVAIGEIVRYRLAMRMAEATATNLQLVDALPAGLQYLNDGTTKVAFVCNGGVVPCMASSGPNAISGAGLVVNGASSAVAPTFVLPGANISGGPFGSGTAPTFTLGNVVNNDTDADSEFVVLEFNALVLNVGGNVSGTNLDNTFTVNINGSAVGAASPAARVTVGEPTAAISKVALPTTGAGGDTISYTVTYSNTGTAPAYDTTVTDSLPALLQLQVGTISVTLLGGASGITNASAGQTVAVGVAVVPVGGSYQVKYNAIVQFGGSPGQVVPNTANASLTTLPGAQGTTPNPTGSTTPAASGTVGERTYAPSAGANVTITQAANLKSILSTSEPSTNLPSVAIGEKIVYQIAVRVPDATTTTGTTLSDSLPAGLAIVSLDSLTASSASLTTSVAGGFAQVLTNARAALASPGQSFTLAFLTLANTDTNTATAETLTLVYTAVVLNTPGNVRGANQNNTATYAWTGGAGGAGSVTGAGPVVTVVEPRLTVAKAVAPTSAYAGDVVTFTLTVANTTATNGADAFDVALSDTVPAGVTYIPGTWQNVSGPVATLNGAGPLTATWATFAQGATSVLRFQARVNASVTPGQSITNTATATWTSLPGSPGTISTFNTNSTERTGSGSPAQNNYTASGPATVTANPRADLKVVKTASPTAVSAGDTITYTLVASNLGPSDATSASLTDPLSSGTTFVSLVSPGTWTCSTPPVGTTGTASCTRALFPAGVDTFTLVVGVPAGTLAGTLIGNTAAITSTTADPDPSNNSSSTSTPVAAATDADLAVTKTGTPAAVVTGQTVTYTVTVTNNGPATAANAVLTDLVPAGTTLVSVAPPVGWSCTTPNVTCTNASVASGASGVFTIQLQATGAAGSTITNTATVLSATNDPVPSNNSANAKTGIVAAPTDADVAITKTGPAGPVAPGSVVTYTLTVVNNGPGTATGVSVEDPPPASSLPAGLSFVANSGACTTGFPCALGSLAPGASATITTQFLVATPFTGPNPFTNSTSVTTTSTDSVLSNNTSSASTSVASAPSDADLSIAKSDSPDPVYAGSNVRYTIVVTNNGPGTATGASVTDNLPAGTSFVSATPSQGSCSGTSTVTCLLGSVAPGETATVTLFVKTSVAGTISNTATVTSTSTDPVSGNNSSTTPTLVVAPDLTIAKSHLPASFVRGSTGTYTLTVSSLAGAAAAPTVGTVTVADTLPAGLTPTGAAGAPDWSCGIVVQTVTCTTSNVLAPGGSYAPITVGVNVLETAPAGVSNTAGVSGGGDVSPGNNSATDPTPVISTGDLSITKTDGVLTVIPGTTTTYTIVVSNSGPSAVTNAPVADTLPGAVASATWTCAATTGSSCGAASGAGSIASTVSLASGGSATYTLVAAISPSATGLLTNTATVTAPAGFTDTNLGNNSATDTGTLTPQADVSIVKTGQATLVPGQNASYTLTAANAGPSTALTVALSDTLPAGTTFVSLVPAAGWACSTPAVGAGGTVSCSIASLAPLASGVFTLTVRVSPTVLTGTVIANTATVTTVTPDPNSNNNSSTTTGNASASADLSVAKTGPARAVPGGPNVVFTTVVTNNGPSDAQAVQLTDVTPANLTFVSATAPCNVSGFPCALGTLAAGASVSITSTYSIPPGYPAPAPILNTATVLSTTPDPTPGNNSSTATVLVPNGVADIAVTKTVSNPAPAVGANVTFTITVSDLGPSDASGLAVTDVLPTGLAFISATPSQGSYGAATGVWTVGSVVNGGSATLAIVATVTQAGAIVNTATKTAGDQTDPNPSNNSGTAVVNGPAAVADIQVQKTVDNATPTAGNNVTFTVTARNAGPSNATGVAVTDSLPPGLTFVSATPSVGSYVPGSGVWTIGDLANGVSVTLALVATVSANGTYVNTAKKTAENEFDPNASNDSAVAGVVAGGGGATFADLGIVKTDSPDPVRAGQNLTYTLVVTNRGPNDATNVTVNDPLPATVSLVSATPSQGGCSGTPLACLLGGLPAGNSATISIVVSVSAAAVPAVTNTANVSATETDPNPGDNSATAATTVLPVADVAVLKTVSNPAPLVTQSFTFTITTTNNGPSTADGVVITDVLPANLGFVSSVASQGAYVSGTGLWTVGTLANGASATLTLTVTALAPGAFTNTATKTGQTELDPNPANDSASASGGVGVVADLTIAKTHAPASFVRGATGTFTLTVSNVGTGPTNAPVTVTDALPAGFTPTAASGTGWGCTVAAPNVSCTRSDVLAAATSWPPISVTVSVLQSAAGSVTNAAQVGGGGDITPGNNGGTDVVLVLSSADLAIVKTGPANAIPGGNVVYTLVVTNNGPSDAAGVSVTDGTPANLGFVSNAGACVTAFPCALGAIPAGASRTITTTFSIPSGYTAPSPIVNVATVSSATADPNLSNNTSTAQTSVAADLSVTKTFGGVSAGGPSAYAIVVTNNGPSVATNVVLTDPLPAALTFFSVSTTLGTCTGGATVSCALGTMPAGATATINVLVLLPPLPLPPIRNTASVTADQFDPDLTNNTSSADISGVPDIPTLSEWGLILMGVALALAGARFLRR